MKIYQLMEKVITPPCNNNVTGRDSMIYNLPVFNFEGLEKTFRKSVTKVALYSKISFISCHFWLCNISCSRKGIIIVLLKQN